MSNWCRSSSTPLRTSSPGSARSSPAAAAHLADSGYADACPIATITLETASGSEPMRQASHAVFENWVAAALPYYTAAGLPTEDARTLIIGLICALEGAFMLARAARSTEALTVAGELCAAAAQQSLTDLR